MDTVICKEVIIATVERRGKGTPHSPVRIITKVYEKDGTVIAEYDPSTELLTPLDAVHFATWCAEKNIHPTGITINTLHQWLDNTTKQ